MKVINESFLIFSVNAVLSEDRNGHAVTAFRVKIANFRQKNTGGQLTLTARNILFPRITLPEYRWRGGMRLLLLW